MSFAIPSRDINVATSSSFIKYESREVVFEYALNIRFHSMIIKNVSDTLGIGNIFLVNGYAHKRYYFYLLT